MAAVVLVAGALAWTARPAMAVAAPSLRSLSVVDTGSVRASSLTVNVPPGVQDGDVLVLFYETSHTGAVGGLTGWVPLDSGNAGDSLEAESSYRVASSEPASYTLTFAHAMFAAAAVFAYTGVDTANPVSAHGAVSQGTWSSSMTGPLLGAVGGSDLVLVAFQARGVVNGPFTFTPPGNGWTERAQDTTTDPLRPAVGESVVEKVGGTDTPSESAGVQVTYVATAVALRAAGSSPQPPPGSPALRSLSTANTATPHSPTLSVQVPPGTRDGDLLVLFLDSTGTAPPAGLAGWTPIDAGKSGNSLRGDAYYRVASGEPSSYTIAFQVALHATATMLAYTNVDTTNPIGAHGVVTLDSYVTSLSSPVLSGVGPSDLVLVAFFARGVPDGPFAMVKPGNGWTEWAQQSTTSPENPDIASSVVAKLGAADGPGETTGVPVTYAAAAVALHPRVFVPCPSGQRTTVRWHYSAGGSPGGWSTTKRTNCTDGSVAFAQQAMEGDLQVGPGSTVSAGYDFTLPANTASYTVVVQAASVVLSARCASGAKPSQPTFTVSIPDRSYAVTGSSWYPSADQHSSLVYQGSVVVPDLCAGGKVRLDMGGRLTATVLLSG